MKRREASLLRPADAPPEPPLDFEDVDIGDDEDFDDIDFITLDTVEILVTEHNGSASRVICCAIDSDPTGVTTAPSSSTRPAT